VGLFALVLGVLPGGPFGRSPGEHAGLGHGATGEAHATLRLLVADESGAAVAGATLRALGVPAATPATTGADGEGRLERVPRGPQVITIDAEGYARARLAVEVGRGSGEVSVVLLPEVLLGGRVLDEGGEPLAGATVLARLDADADANSDADAAFETRSGDDGAFLVHGLPGERVVLEVRSDGFEASVRAFDLERGAVRTAVVVLRRSGTLVGQVRRPDGAGAAEAEVVLAGSGVWPPRRILADEDGRFRWTGLPSGIYEVRARKGSLVAAPVVGVTVGPERPTTIDLRLVAGTVLEGVVLDVRTEAPIEGAVISVAEEALSLDVRATLTDDQGRFRVEGLLPGAQRLTVQATGYVRFGPEPVATGGEPIRVPLVRAATLEGIVVDERDRPVAGAVVEVLGDAAFGSGIASTGFGRDLFAHQSHGPVLLESGGELGVTLGKVSAFPIGSFETIDGPQAAAAGAFALGPTTDSEGRFHIEGIAPGTVQIRVVHPPHAPALGPPLRLVAGEAREDIRVVLPDGGEVEGRVVDSRGYPVGSIVVTLHAEREPVPRTLVAGEDGTFTFGGVLGAAVLTALPTDQPAARARVEVASGERLEVDLALGESLGRLDGRVRDARDFPIAGARVSLVSLRASAPFERSTFTGEDGTFQFTAVPEPPLRVKVDHFAYAPYRSATIDSWGDELELVLDPGGVVTGRVLDERTDAPIAGARITLKRDGQTLLERATSADGSFEAERVPVGPLQIEVSHVGYVERALARQLAGSRFGAANLELGEVALAPAGRVDGRVLDAVGEPVADAEVRLVGGRVELSAQSGAGGRFAIDPVPMGTYELEASHPSAGNARATQALRLEPGSASRTVELRMDGRYAEAEEDMGPGLEHGVAIEVATVGGAVQITWVAEGSAAARAGLRVGDVVLSVDDDAVEVASQARSRLRGPAGVSAVIEVARGDRSKHVRAPREAYRPPR
jgi:protocatechuate 3,4-dioxygenase beta subunit